MRLRYELRITTLIGSNEIELPSGIAVSFNGIPLTNLRKMSLKVWNAGTQAVRRTDVVRPITVTLPINAQIFTATVAKQSIAENDVSFIQIDPGANSLVSDFLFLEVGHGFNVEALYTGPDAPIQITTTVINMPQGLFDIGSARENFGRREFFTYILPALGALVVIFIGSSRIPLLSDITSYWFFLPPLAAIGLAATTASLMRRSREKLSPPPDLRH